MSIPVDLDQLEDALADFTFAYLVTVGDDHRAHTVALDPVLVDGVFDLGGVGNRTRANAESHPDVTLVWPPREGSEYTLIVDGRAERNAEALTIRATSAVLHRRKTADRGA